MTQGTFPITIQAPPSVVWPWIARLEKHPGWSPKPYSMEWEAGDPNAVGSTFRSVGWVPGDKHHVNRCTITQVVANERFALESQDREGLFHSSYTLRPVGDATEVSFEIVFPKMKGFAAVAAPPAFALIGKADIRKRMQLLNAKVEGSG